MPLRVVHSHGTMKWNGRLHAVIADPQSPFGEAFDELRRGRVVSSNLKDAPAHARWYAYLGAQGVTERAMLPMVREGQLFGVVGLYAQGPGAFDPSQLNLLNEMTADLEFALNGIAQNERRQAAEARAEISEFRFREVFEASPTPMQIQSLSAGAMRAINRAHQQWLGYARSDLPRSTGSVRLSRPRRASATAGPGGIRRSGKAVRSRDSTCCKDGSGASRAAP
jgi:PAS domain-containing protein